DALGTVALRQHRDVAVLVPAHLAQEQDHRQMIGRAQAAVPDALALEVFRHGDVGTADDVEARHVVGGGENDPPRRGRNRGHAYHGGAAAPDIDLADDALDVL